VIRAGLRLLLPVAVAASLAACGGAAVFGLTSDDNNRDTLSRALAMRQLPASPAPRNATGKPMLFGVASGKPRKLVAYDLAAGAVRWTVDADVQSRIAVGGDFVVAREGSDLVARAIADGKIRWKQPIPGTFVGAAADAERAYVVYQEPAQKRPVWWLIAYGAGGEELWRHDAPGPLGAPAAQNGLVLSPFLTQWLSLLDGRTGAQLTRIRGIDAEIAFVRVTSDAAFFGSTGGIFRLDDHAASGRRATSTFAAATLPKQLARATYGASAFDPVQASYSAADRTRVLWRAAPTGDGFHFAKDEIAVHWFRFVFGLSPGGELRWAYSHPRVELVASEHAGSVIATASAAGEVVALDPATGAVRWTGKIDLGGGQLLGATFDADGWAPQGDKAERTGTVAALLAIARDRDARFEPIKEMAVSALSTLPGPDVTRDLLSIVTDARTPAKLRQTVADVLVGRKDPAGLPVLTAALAVRADHVTGAAPKAVDVVARAVAALDGVELDPAARKAAVDALVGQLTSAATDAKDLPAVVDALAAIGGGEERGPLGSFLLLHRCDPEVAAQSAVIKAVIGALVLRGGPTERELVRFVAEDARTEAAVATQARQILSQTR